MASQNHLVSVQNQILASLNINIDRSNLHPMDTCQEFLPKNYKKTNCRVQVGQLIPKKKKRSKQKGHYAWSIQQNLVYSQSLIELKQEFITEFERRSSRVFRKISTLLPNRTPQQCRSHHQKMIKSYKTIEGIYEHFQELKAFKKRDIQSSQGNSQAFSVASEDNILDDFSTNKTEEKEEDHSICNEFSQINAQMLIIENEYRWDDVFNF